MPTNVLSIAENFSRVPSGRFRTDGPYSGQAFREDYLVPRLQSNSVLVDLDGVAGLPVSFLEEAFGGLVRCHSFTPTELEKLLEFRAETPRMQTYPKMIRGYIARAKSPADTAR